MLCAMILIMSVLPLTAAANGNGNMDGSGGGSMGQGTSQNKWSPGNDGVRITVVDADSGAAVSSPVDFSNRRQEGTVLHFGKINKLQYRSGTDLSLQPGGYRCFQQDRSIPSIVNSTGRNNIEA